MIKLLKNKICEINSIIGDLTMEFQAAKSRVLWQQYKTWKNGLNKEEIKVIRKYRLGTISPGKRNINAYLRLGTNDDIKKNQEVEILKKALSKAKIENNAATYRTINKYEHSFLRQYNINDIFVNRDFKGTHVSQYIFKNTTSAYIVYLIPKGYTCAYINYWVHIFMHEKELLLTCDSKCKIIDIKHVFNKECYIIEVLK